MAWLLATLLASGSIWAADPSSEPFDPWQGYNRRMNAFNVKVDRYIAKPLARFYTRVAPRPVRIGVRNFFTNMYQPLTAANLLLQGRPKRAGSAVGRFALNLTLGLGGVLDPATAAGINLYHEDLGQTLGVWGWRKSRYFVIPFLGPSTLRDALGEIGQYEYTPFEQIDPPERYYVGGLYLVDLRSSVMAADELVGGGVGDDYLLLRDAHLQRRAWLISGEKTPELPAYLNDFDEDEATPEPEQREKPPRGAMTMPELDDPRGALAAYWLAQSGATE